MPIKEEHYHLRSTHTQQKENQEYTREEKKKDEDYCAIRLQNTHTHTHANNCLQKKIRICLEIEKQKVLRKKKTTLS